MATGSAFKVNDRVKRKELKDAKTAHVQGCHGKVKELRTDVTVTNPDAREKGLMLKVLWDNGTFSYVSPEAVEIVRE